MDFDASNFGNKGGAAVETTLADASAAPLDVVAVGTATVGTATVGTATVGTATVGATTVGVTQSAPARNSSPELLPEPSLSQGKVRVLLIDDDEDELVIVRALLRESAGTVGALGFELDWTPDVSAALERIAACDYDAYLVDYRLGDGTGLQLIERAVAAGCDAPLILLSGQDDPRVDSQAMRVGATDYLVKDQLSGALLERTLRYALAGKASERKLRAVAAQNARLQAAIEAANVGVALSEMRDGDSIVTYVNPAFTQMTGYSPAEIVGNNLSVLGARETAPELVQEVRSRMRKGESGAGLALNFRRDGSSFWNEGSYSAIPVAPGEPIKYVGFFQDVSARIAAEAAAAEARRNLEIAQQITHLGSWSYHFSTPGQWEGNVGFWSDETYRILGAEPNAFVPSRESWFERVAPEHLEEARQALDRAMEEGADYSLDCRVTHRDGSERFVETRAQIERDARGKALFMNGTILDITDRRRAERAERELETRLQTVTQTAPVILWSLDMEGKFTLSEGHILRALGLEPGQVVGQSAFEIYADNSQVLGVCQRALRGEVCQEIMESLGLSFAVHVAPEWNERGEQIGIVGISYDVTQQLQAQRALLESEARFERIMPGVPGMVYSVERPVGSLGLDDRFLYVSEACREIFGVEPAAVLENARHLIETFDAGDIERLRETLIESARDLTPWTLEFGITRPDGRRRRVRAQSRPARSEIGSVIWDGVMIDLTESQRAQQELKHSRRALDEAQNLARIGSFSWNLRTDESVWSDQLYRLYEMTPGEPVVPLRELVTRYHPDDRELLLQRIDARVTTGGAGMLVARLIQRDGSIRHMEVRSSVQCDEQGAPWMMTGSLQDITDRVEAERALRESEERYALAARGTNDGLWDWNLTTGEFYYSSHWKKMVGCGESEIGNAPDEWLGRIHPDDVAGVRAHIDAHVSGQSPLCECEYRLRTAQGEYRWMLGRGQALFDETGVATRLSGSQSDITERKIAENQLEYNAFYDTALTNLPNRALFAERLDRTIARGNRHPEHTFAVLFLDIDHFKKVNDSLGHLTGDRLLVEAATRFQRCLRPGDTVARFGGDEFAILLEDVGSIDDVHQVADRIHAELETPFPLDGHEAFVTVSMGIVMGQGDGASAEELIRSADTAMYRAKGAGRGRHELFEVTMHTRAVKMLEMETDLRRALERDELRLHYQPIIDLSTGKINGCEALVRWQHSQFGLVSPGDFIPLAEETGLIVPVGWWVLEEACRQGLIWQREFGELRMSVNLSPKQLSQPDMFARVQGILERTGFDPKLLKLEVTETVIMESAHNSIAMFVSLKDLGIKFAMDDFGTGYSSLSYLHRFPLDAIKIDRSFVSHMKPGGRDHEIVGTIISMARGLKMRVVAEGVESPEQLDYLREMGCGFAQGFYMSKPQPAEQIAELLKRDLHW